MEPDSESCAASPANGESLYLRSTSNPTTSCINICNRLRPPTAEMSGLHATASEVSGNNSSVKPCRGLLSIAPSRPGSAFAKHPAAFLRSGREPPEKAVLQAEWGVDRMRQQGHTTSQLRYRRFG